MKHILNRAVSVIFASIIAVGIFAGMSLPANAAVSVTHRIAANGAQYEVWTGASGGASQGTFATLKDAADWIAANEASPVIQFGDGVTPLSVPTTTDWLSSANILPDATYTGKVVSSGDNQYLFVVKDGVQISFVDIEIQNNSQYSGAKTVYVFGSGTKLIVDGTSTQMVSTAPIINIHSGTADIKAGLITTGTAPGATAVHNQSSGIINISGGTITAGQYAVYNRGQINITGGTVEGTGNGKAVCNDFSGIVNISGGTVSAQDGNALYQTDVNATINISGNASNILSFHNNKQL